MEPSAPAAHSARADAEASGRRPVELLLLGLVCAFRFWDLGGPGLWADEAYTAVVSGQSLSSIRAALREDDAPALFYLAEKVVLSILGDSEWAVRFFPAFCGAAAVAASYLLLRRHAPSAAMAGIVVAGFSTLACFYSQQARNYSLLHLLTVLLIGSLLRLRERPAPARALALAAISLCLLYTHNLALWTVAAASILGLLSLRASFGGREGKSARRAAVTLLLAIALGAIPWGVHVLQQLGPHQGANQWISTWWETRWLALAPFYSATVFLNGGSAVVHPPVPVPALAESAGVIVSAGRTLLPMVLAVLAIIAVAHAFRSSASRQAGVKRRRVKKQAPEARANTTDETGMENAATQEAQPRVAGMENVSQSGTELAWILGICTLAPLAGLLLTHLLVGPAYVVARTDTLALFPFLLLLAYGWSRANRSIRTVSLALWTLTFLLPWIPELGRTATKGSDRALAHWLSSKVEEGDAVVAALVGRPTLEYYGARQGWLDRLGSLSTFPPIGDRNPAAAFPTPIDSLEAYRDQARQLRESWEQSGVSTVWCEVIRIQPEPDHPQYPAAPPPARERIDANAISFPTSLLVYTLIGLQQAEVSAEYRRDWMGGARVLLEIPRSSWVPIDSLPAEIEIR